MEKKRKDTLIAKLEKSLNIYSTILSSEDIEFSQVLTINELSMIVDSLIEDKKHSIPSTLEEAKEAIADIFSNKNCTNMDISSLIEALRKIQYYLTMNLPLPKDDIDLILQSLSAYGVIEYPSLWLTREGDFTDVRIEINKQWTTLIRENYDGYFSHIIRSSGIKRLITNAIDVGEG